MPSYPKENESVNLADYKQVKNLSNGKTNDVYLWEHKEDSNIKIVVKKPYGKNTDLIQHNLKAINAFFGAASAWPVQGEKAFAMKYYAGKPLLGNESSHFINDNNSPIRTIEKNGLLFTMLDPNDGNFLKVSSGEIIPIDFDYMIIHDNTQLLDYQKVYLDGRMSFATRMGADTTDDAVKYVISSYPKAHDYLLKQWGSRYIDKSPQISPVVETPVLSPKVTTKAVKPKEAFVLVDELGNNFVDSVEVKNGNYIIIGRNSSNATRSITIDKDGNATGYKGSKDLGAVGKQMYERRAAIFEHFEIVPAVVKGISPLPKVHVELPKVKEAFVLKDEAGNNLVESVEEKDGAYIIKGKNSYGAPRSITIDKNGNATGYQGSKDLGIVGNQMYEERAAIFEHFKIHVPYIEKSISPPSKVVEPHVAQTTKVHVDQDKKQEVTLSTAKDTFFKSPIQTPVVQKVEPSSKSSIWNYFG